MGALGDGFNRMGREIGAAIGEGYAKQGKSWDEVASMPSSGSGPGKDAMHSSVKTGYDNYMAQNKPVVDNSIPITSDPSSSLSGNGLAASALQPTLTSGVQNSVADSSVFGNMTNGLGENRFGARGLAASGNQQNGYQILGAPRII